MADIPDWGQLSLSMDEQRYMYGAQFSANGTGMPVVVGPDPVAADRTVFTFEILPGGSDSFSRWKIEVEEELNELWLNFELYVDHAGTPEQNLLEILRLRRVNNGTVAEFSYRNVGTVWHPWGQGQPHANSDFTDDIPFGEWHAVRLRYTAASMSGADDGILQAWVDDTLQLDTTHSNTNPVGRIEFYCRATDEVADLPDSKLVHVRKLSWGRTEQEAEWRELGLQLGNVSSPEGAPDDITARLRYQLDIAHYGTSIDDGSLMAQFEYKLATDKTWISNGPPDPLTADALGEYIRYHNVTGLTPGAEYDFRVVVSNGSGFNLQSEPGRVTMPSSASGLAAGTYSVAFGSCNGMSWSQNPQLSYDFIREHPADAMLHLGDIFYETYNLGDLGAHLVNTEAAYRKRHRFVEIHNREFTDMARTLGFFGIWDDHEVRDSWTGTDHINYAAAAPAQVEYIAKRRLNAFTGVGHGFWWETAETLFIVPDVRTFRDDTTYLGAAQLAKISDLLATRQKAFVFFCSAGPVSRGMDDTADSWHRENVWLAELQTIIDDFLASGSSRMIILSGDRHLSFAVDDWDHPRVGPEYCAGPTGTWTRDPMEFFSEPENPTPIFIGIGSAAVGANGRIWGLVEVDEVNRTAELSFREGDTVLFSQTIEAECPWDCGNDDGFVDTIDFLALLSEWGQLNTPCDVTGGGVDTLDLLEMLAAWGRCQ